MESTPAQGTGAATRGYCFRVPSARAVKGRRHSERKAEDHRRQMPSAADTEQSGFWEREKISWLSVRGMSTMLRLCSPGKRARVLSPVKSVFAAAAASAIPYLQICRQEVRACGRNVSEAPSIGAFPFALVRCPSLCDIGVCCFFCPLARRHGTCHLPGEVHPCCGRALIRQHATSTRRKLTTSLAIAFND